MYWAVSSNHRHHIEFASRKRKLYATSPGTTRPPYISRAICELSCCHSHPKREIICELPHCQVAISCQQWSQKLPRRRSSEWRTCRFLAFHAMPCNTPWWHTTDRNDSWSTSSPANLWWVCTSQIEEASTRRFGMCSCIPTIPRRMWSKGYISPKWVHKIRATQRTFWHFAWMDHMPWSIK